MTVGIRNEEPTGDDPDPFVRLYVNQGQVHSYRSYVDALTDGVVTVGEVLSVEFLHLTPLGPRLLDLPRTVRADLRSAVLASGSFLTVLGPDLAATFDRERLRSVPAVEVRELAGGSVIVRGWPTMEAFDDDERAGMREHLGLAPHERPDREDAFDGHV